MSSTSEKTGHPTSASRRKFLKAGFAVIACLPILESCKKDTEQPPTQTKVKPSPNKQNTEPPKKAAVAHVPFPWKGEMPPKNAVVADPKSAISKAIHYVETTKGKTGLPSNFKAGRRCDNCRFYQKLNNSWGKCTILQLKAVTAEGWCKTWVKQVG